MSQIEKPATDMVDRIADCLIEDHIALMKALNETVYTNWRTL